MNILITLKGDPEPAIRDLDTEPTSVPGIHLSKCPCCTTVIVVHQPAGEPHANVVAAFEQRTTALRWIDDVIAPLTVDWTAPLEETRSAAGGGIGIFVQRTAFEYERLARSVLQTHMQLWAAAGATA